MATIRLTTAQAIIRFLKNQYVKWDAQESNFFAGILGIFGHGNVAGIGQALQENLDFPYILVRNEQSAVHLACGFAKMKNRKQTFACTSSIGPGATNMITGAALATINRLPVLLLPGDIFARRNVAPFCSSSNPLLLRILVSMMPSSLSAATGIGSTVLSRLSHLYRRRCVF
jgi:3D-(3,5/4)-trihydroxycyclohexane-1,2-dione acylhydrolase (decyclizing)